MRTRVTATGEPTVDVRFCLVFPRETISVPVVRRVLGDTLNKLGVDDESVADLLLGTAQGQGVSLLIATHDSRLKSRIARQLALPRRAAEQGA